MMRTIAIPINGMTCGGCAGTVRYALANVVGVVHAQVEVGAATIMYDPAHTNDEALRGVIAQAGFEPVIG